MSRPLLVYFSLCSSSAHEKSLPASVFGMVTEVVCFIFYVMKSPWCHLMWHTERNSGIIKNDGMQPVD